MDSDVIGNKQNGGSESHLFDASIGLSISKERQNVKDRWNIVYLIFLLHGMGMLMSWNMFITIAPQYYVDYWFTENGNKTKYAGSFMSIIGVTSQIPNVGIMFINMAVTVAGSLMLRIVVPLIINSLLVVVIIAFVIFLRPNSDDINWFYIVTLIIIMLMNLCNGVYQNSIYGIVADFPENYPNSLIIGNNLCGIFTSLMSIMTTCISPNGIELNALLYFSISLGIIVLCGVSLCILVNLPYYKYHMAIGLTAREESDTEHPNLRQYWECFTHCWVQLFNNFFVYFISLMIFPAMMSDTPYYQSSPNDKWGSIFPKNLYFAINTFLNFNVFASVGSLIANYVQWPTPRWLWVPIVARVLFVPFFMFCNYKPSGVRNLPVIFKNEWWFTIGGSIMALTCGYLSSLALIYTPSAVPASYQKISGMAAAIALMLGILCGVSFTPVIASITHSW